MNRVTLSGRLTRDPELRTTNGGKSVCSFNLAIDKKMSAEKRDRAKENGEPTADFPLCQVWGHDAEYLCNYGRKGALVEIDGRLTTRSYDDRDGRKVYVTEVVADELQLVREQPKEDADAAYLTGGGNSYTKDQVSQDIAAETSDDLPF